jgi:hypothetical protein
LIFFFALDKLFTFSPYFERTSAIKTGICFSLLFYYKLLKKL